MRMKRGIIGAQRGVAGGEGIERGKHDANFARQFACAKVGQLLKFDVKRRLLLVQKRTARKKRKHEHWQHREEANRKHPPAYAWKLPYTVMF